MTRHFFILTIVFTLIVVARQNISAQTPNQQDKYILWKGVKIYEFKERGCPDTLEICHGEWIVKGRATNLDSLSESLLNKIAKTVKKSKCSIVYVDLKNIWDTKETWPKGIYCLGLNPRKD